MLKLEKEHRNILFIASIVAVGLTVGLIYLFLREPNIKYTYDVVGRQNLVQEVKVSGQVKSAESVDLTLLLTGKVSKINAQVGDKVSIGQIILELENADLAAQVAQAQAVLNKQLAGNTNDYIAQLQAALDKANNDLMQAQGVGSGPDNSKLVSNAYDDLMTNLQGVQVVLGSSLTAADNILGIDNIMANDNFEDYLATLHLEKLAIAQGAYRSARTAKLAFDDSFNNLGAVPEHSAIENTAQLGEEALNQEKTLLFALSEVLDATPPVGKLTQTSLDSMKTGIQTVRANVAAKDTALVAGEHAIQVARDNYFSLKAVADRAASALADAKNPPRDVDTAASRAALALAQANYAKTILRSPINGIITKQDAKVGGLISPSVSLVSVIDPTNYQVDVYLSEADIAKVQVGDKANITFDSYGAQEVFSATVVKADPAGITQSNGVTSYKITLQFDKLDDRIKVGLTANVDIVSANKTQVLALPDRDILQKTDGYYVFVKNSQGGNPVATKVELGILDNNGQREITSGLTENMQVVSYGLSQ